MMLRDVLAVLLGLSLLGSARADDAADALSQGRDLAQRLLEHRPTENFSATGTLNLRDGNGRKTEVPLSFDTVVTATNWRSDYQAGDPGQTCILSIIHTEGQPDAYEYVTNATGLSLGRILVPGHLPHWDHLTGGETLRAFAGSDFWITDLGLEFLHWPQQKFLRKEIKRSQGCSVLESTNPYPTAGGYARVVSWIDTENGGIVQAYAYDTANQKLKEFYPEDLKKVNGQWQVGMMEMDNDQTGSRTRLKFNLDAAGSPQK